MTDTLRRQAEELAKKNEATREGVLTPEETRQTLHELRVHQIELEMQNEELRRAQTELDATRARYFDLYDLAPVGYCTVNEQGLILEANLAAATILGLDRSTLVNKPFTRFILKKDQDLYYLRRKQLFETTTPQTYDLRMVKKDGTELWVNLATSIALDAESAPVCRVVINNITERKQEEQFREKVEQIIQHDIKGPLTNLFSLAQVAMSGELDASLTQVFPQIMLGIRQVIHLIDSAEPLRQMEKGEYTPRRNPVKLLQTLCSVKDSLAVLASQRLVEIVLPSTAESASRGEPLLYGEEYLIEDMFMNLVKNAVEASPQAAPVRVFYRAEPAGQRVAIHNHGVVPEAIRGRFFEKDATFGKTYGTGLGTYSAQLIAKAHGGSIAFTTSEAEGTTVTVVLPACASC